MEPQHMRDVREYPVEKEVAERQRWLELEQPIAEAERRGV
jgi:hypothetical protein